MMNYYQVLEVSIAASRDDIEKAYNSLVTKIESDSGAARRDDAALILKEAYDTLRDPERRQAHDRALREAICPNAPAAKKRAIDIDFSVAALALEGSTLTLTFPSMAAEESAAFLAEAQALITSFANANGGGHVGAIATSDGLVLSIDQFLFDSARTAWGDHRIEALACRVASEKEAQGKELDRSKRPSTPLRQRLAEAPPRVARSFFNFQNTALISLPVIAFFLVLAYFALEQKNILLGAGFGFVASLITGVFIRYLHYGIALVIGGVILAGVRLLLFLPEIWNGPTALACLSCHNTWKAEEVQRDKSRFELLESGAHWTITACPTPGCKRSAKPSPQVPIPEPASFKERAGATPKAALSEEEPSPPIVAIAAKEAPPEPHLEFTPSLTLEPSATQQVPQRQCNCKASWPEQLVKKEPLLFLFDGDSITACPKCASSDGLVGDTTAKAVFAIFSGELPLKLSSERDLKALTGWRLEVEQGVQRNSKLTGEVRDLFFFEYDFDPSDLRFIGYYEPSWEPLYYKRMIEAIQKSPTLLRTREDALRDELKPGERIGDLVPKQVFSMVPAMRGLAEGLSRDNPQVAQRFNDMESLYALFEERAGRAPELDQAYFDSLRLKGAAREATTETLIELIKHALFFREHMRFLLDVRQKVAVTKKPLLDALKNRTDVVKKAIAEKKANPKPLTTNPLSWEENKEYVASELSRWVKDIRTEGPFIDFCEDNLKFSLTTLSEADRKQTEVYFESLLRKHGVPDDVIRWAIAALYLKRGLALKTNGEENIFDHLVKDKKPSTGPSSANPAKEKQNDDAPFKSDTSPPRPRSGRKLEDPNAKSSGSSAEKGAQAPSSSLPTQESELDRLTREIADLEKIYLGKGSRNRRVRELLDTASEALKRAKAAQAELSGASESIQTKPSAFDSKRHRELQKTLKTNKEAARAYQTMIETALGVERKR